jgi:hypothetical protein
VKRPKGFGKTYFSLSSILAYSVARTMNAQISAVTALVSCRFSHEDEIEEDDPPNEILELHTFHNDFKPCLCSCYFNHLAHIMLHIHHYIPRCPYYTTYFAFRRTGVHPPILSFHKL